MEAEAQYWMWMKRQQRYEILKSFSNSSSSLSSWEEKAFAEDTAAARSHGGLCIWPPRSYSCGFCRRDFKSAQALGGHMNVHRRDRARLKNSLNNNKLSTNPNNNCPPSDHHYSSPSNNNNNNVVVIASSSSSSSSPPLPPLSNSKVSATSSTIQENSVETKLSMGLKPNTCCDEATSSKRIKTGGAAVSTLFPFFISSSSNENFNLQKENNLDLELRLGGDPPKVL